MMAGLLRVLGLALGVAGAGGCATQHGTSQALTVAGAAAVVVGASMAADARCYDGPSEGAALVYCAENASKGVRNTGKAIAVAGVGLAAAGYALKPKGPDNLRRARSDPDGAPASPYRLIRRAPPSEPPSEPTPEPPSEAAPGSVVGVPEGDGSEGDGSEGDGAEGDGSEGDGAEPGPESPPTTEPVEPPGEPVEPPRSCPPGSSAGSAAAGACSPERAPATAPTPGAR